LFYAVLIWMPLTGYLMVIAAGFPPKLFDVINTPVPIAKNDSLAKMAMTLHVYGQWLVYGLLILHISGVAFQLMIRKNGVLGRMLPPNALDPITDQPKF
jgi:cytochrome b561